MVKSRRKRRRKPKNRVIREIIRQQLSTALIFPQAPFRRLVVSICHELNYCDIQFQDAAIVAIQTTAEAELIRTFKSANLIAVVNGRETILKKDMFVADRLINNKP